MKKSDALKQKRAALLRKWEGLVKRAKKENRELSSEEKKSIKKWRSKMNNLDDDIEDAKDLEERKAKRSKANGKKVKGGNPEERELGDMKKRYSLHKAIRSQMPNGVLDGVEKEIHEETVKRAKEAGISITGVAIPAPESRKAQTRADGQTVTEDSGNFGGNLVDTTLGSPIELLRPKPILRQMGARFITGLTGNVAFPTNEGGISASWEGEVSEVSTTRNQYGKKGMEPKRLAVSTLLSLQNLMQSSPSLERMTVEDMRAAVEEKIDLAGINGSGTGNIPLGILNASGTNAVAAGTNGDAPTWAQLVDLETGIFVQNANSSKMGYIMNTGTKGRLKKTKHEAGDLGYLMDKKNMVNGYEVGVTNLVPGDLTKGTGTNLNAGIFGDFNQLLIGQWAFYDMSVDDKSRKKEGYVEITLNTFLDILLRQPKAFSVIKDWAL